MYFKLLFFGFVILFANSVFSFSNPLVSIKEMDEIVGKSPSSTNYTITSLTDSITKNPVVCSTSYITGIKFATTGITSNSQIATTNLPAGVTGYWMNNVYSISGFPTVTGVFNYRVYVIGTTTSISGTITVNKAVVTGSLKDTTLNGCINTTTMSLKGFTGTNLQWYSSTTGGTYSMIPGATNSTFTTQNVSNTTYYKVLVSTPGCSSYYSTFAKANVIKSVAGSFNDTLVNGCTNTVKLNLTGYVGTVQWMSYQGGSYVAIPGAVGSPYTISNLSATSFYKASVTNNGCPAALADMKIVTVTGSKGGIISNDTTVFGCNNTVNLSVSGYVGTTFQWYSSTTGGTYTAIQGATGINYSTQNLLKTTYFKVLVSNGGCASVFSSTSKVTVIGSIGGTIKDTIVNSCVNNSAKLVLTGYTGNTFQWYSSTTGGNYLPITGATNSSYIAQNSSKTTYYKVSVSNNNCSAVYSSIGTITASGNVGGTIRDTIVNGCSNSVNLKLNGYIGSNFQWYSSSNGGTYSVIPGAISSTFSTQNIIQNTYYKVLISSGTCASVYSGIGVVTVIGSQGGTLRDTIINGCNTNLDLTLKGYIGDNFQWYSSTNGGAYSLIPGATSPYYHVSNVSQNTYYKVKVSNKGCSEVYSGIGSITTIPSQGGILKDTILNTCTNSVVMNLKDYIGTTFQWYSSTTGGNYLPIVGAKSASYTAINVGQTTYYKVEVSNNGCASVYSSIGSIVVNGSIGGIVLGDTVISGCENSTLLSLKNYTGTIFQWQQSLNGGIYTDILAATSPTYLAKNNLVSTNYRVKVRNGSCFEAISSTASIQVIGSIGGSIERKDSVELCTTFITLKSVNQTGDKFQWQESVNGGAYTNISGATNSFYTFYNQTSIKSYRVLVSNNLCTSVASTIITIDKSKLDTIAPVIDCPKDITIKTSMCDATLKFPLPIAVDNCSNATISLVSGIPANGVFPVGITTNVYKAVDISGNESTCSHKIIVQDIHDVSITCPKNIIQKIYSSCNSYVYYTPPAYSGNCTSVFSQTAGLGSGINYPVGVTKNTFKIMDAVGRVDSCSFTVSIIRMNTVPNIVCPANIVVNSMKDSVGAIVSFNTPIATDACPGSVVSLSKGLTSNSLFPIGITQQRFLVTNASGDTSSCGFTVNVLDIQPPKIVCPKDTTIFMSEDSCTTSVAFQLPKGDDNSTKSVITQIGGVNQGSILGESVNNQIFKIEDAAGNSTTCSFKLYVKDIVKPVINCPNNITVTAGPNCDAIVDYSMPLFSDNCTRYHRFVEPELISGLYTGSTFPAGKTTNTYRITDGSGNSSTCQFYVNVISATTPTITCPNDIIDTLDADSCTKMITYLKPVGLNICSNVMTTQVKGFQSGDKFPSGETINTFIAQSSSGLSKTCSFKVKLIEKIAPTITCPGNILTSITPGKNRTIVDFSLPTAIDNCSSVTINRISGIAPKDSFPAGITTEIYEAIDLSGNKSTCSFTVTVQDFEPPTIDCPSNITQTITANTCYDNVIFTEPIGIDNSLTAVTTRIKGFSPNSPFPIGTTEQSYTVTDVSGNSASCSFTITVLDQVPQITCPPSIIQNLTPATCASGAEVMFSPPIGIDNCFGAITTQIGGFTSGTCFPLGITTQTYKVVDANGNSNTCSFDIEVTDQETSPCNFVIPNTIASNPELMFNKKATNICPNTPFQYTVYSLSDAEGYEYSYTGRGASIRMVTNNQNASNILLIGNVNLPYTNANDVYVTFSSTASSGELRVRAYKICPQTGLKIYSPMFNTECNLDLYKENLAILYRSVSEFQEKSIYEPISCMNPSQTLKLNNGNGRDSYNWHSSNSSITLSTTNQLTVNAQNFGTGGFTVDYAYTLPESPKNQCKMSKGFNLRINMYTIPTLLKDDTITFDCFDELNSARVEILGILNNYYGEFFVNNNPYDYRRLSEEIASERKHSNFDIKYVTTYPYSGCKDSTTLHIIFDENKPSRPEVNYILSDSLPVGYITCMDSLVWAKVTKKDNNLNYMWYETREDSTYILKDYPFSVLNVTSKVNGCSADFVYSISQKIQPPIVSPMRDTFVTCIVPKLNLGYYMPNLSAQSSWVNTTNDTLFNVGVGSYVFQYVDPVSGCQNFDTVKVIQKAMTMDTTITKYYCYGADYEIDNSVKFYVPDSGSINYKWRDLSLNWVREDDIQRELDDILRQQIEFEMMRQKSTSGTSKIYGKNLTQNKQYIGLVTINGNCTFSTLYNLNVVPKVELLQADYFLCDSTKKVVLIYPKGGDSKNVNTSGLYNYSFDYGPYKKSNLYLGQEEGIHSVMIKDTTYDCVSSQIFNVRVDTNLIKASFLAQTFNLPKSNVALVDNSNYKFKMVSWELPDGLTFSGITDTTRYVTSLDTGTYEIIMTGYFDTCSYSFRKTITFLDTIEASSDDEEYLFLEYGVYPNPTKGTFRAVAYSKQAQNAYAFVTDVLGNVITTSSTINGKGFKFDFDIDDVADGLYFVHIVGEYDTVVLRVIKSLEINPS